VAAPAGGRLVGRGLSLGWPSVFDALQGRLNAALGGLRPRGRLDDESIARALREIRLALLEADVNLDVVRAFTERVRARALGEEVRRSLTPGQQVVKVVHDELTALLGGETAAPELGGRVLLAGLQGSGKTTAAAKLARRLAAEGRRPALVAADLQRPAAIDQLEQLGAQLGVPVYRTATADPVEAARAGLERARADGRDVVIVDTAGRLQIDEPLMDELARVRDAVRPTATILVLDAMTGQEAVAVARTFEERLGVDGVLLTKLDGDARGGAALSVASVTGKPILLASTGERLDALERFHPDRMASRILGMGDVLTLVERAEQAASAEEQARLEAQLNKGRFTFDDFLAAQRMLRRMGPLQGVLKLLPGLGGLPEASVDEAQLGRVEAIVLSMTPHERAFPHAIDGRRRARIARGSGTSVAEVSRLLEARKAMERLMKQVGQGKLPSLPGLPGAAGGPPGAPGRTRHPGSKKKAKRRARRR